MEKLCVLTLSPVTLPCLGKIEATLLASIFLDVISWGNQRWRREMSVVFSGYTQINLLSLPQKKKKQVVRSPAPQSVLS